MNKKILLRYCVREILGLVVMGAALFWSAGRLDWWPAWATLAIMFAWILGTFLVILRHNPDLLAERLGPRKNAKPWDMKIMSVLGLLQLCRYIIAGLDQRFAWTGGFPHTVQISALIVCAAGYALVVWATSVNAFFSQIVRLQPDRGQYVIKSGPYLVLRHPAYLGAILFELAVPLLLASWWSFLPSILATGLLLLRTTLEDQTLKSELAGYAEYVNQVRFRLLPGIW